ncbi:Uncharacterized protein family Cys-rich [Macleaya cordata]|uniref:Uncharacterized protein family Cys-rich n=1 Tax=Macleaya cordata TaxID=56857 RepID=A0A200PX51_MACCD|nr:Uncharacterized protein family Cys-rich [Macleaya cordata]
MASYAQAAGVDALRLITMIVTAARNATTHRKNCEQIAAHVKIIGNLLEKLKSSTDLKKIPATREPLDQLEEALRRTLELVESCREKSYLYLLAMGWSIVYQFRQAQAEIDRYLKLVPLISLVHGYLVQERLQAIEEDNREEDNREYTLDEEDEAAQNAIMKPGRTREDARILEKSLSRRYPNLEFDEALQEENKKLQVELQRSQVDNDPKQSNVIQHLIEVTQNVVSVPPQKNNRHHHLPQIYTGPGSANIGRTAICSSEIQWFCSSCRHDFVMKSGTTGAHDLISELEGRSEWQTDLFDCCREPCLCLKTCFYPCGTFKSIASVASNGIISREHACHDLMAYSLAFGCCCYTCWVRGKLRKLFGIEGGLCDDFLSHLMCCCCALVQEWHEIELRGYDGYSGKKMNPPPSQDMKP